MKKPNFTELKDRLKNIFSFKKKHELASEDEAYLDAADAEYEDENPAPYEEDDEESDSPPVPMDIPRPPIDIPPPFETAAAQEQTPDLPTPEEDDDEDFSATLPGGVAPKELKLGQQNQGQILRQKMAQKFNGLGQSIRLKLAGLLKKDQKISTATISEWWSKSGENLLQKPFRPQYRPQIHQIFLWLIAVVFAVQVGKMLALVLTPKTSPQPRLAIAPIATRNTMDLDALSRNDLFGAKGDVREEQLTPKKPINENIICKSANRKSSLPLELLNTVVLKDSVKSIASVQTRGSREFLNVREGDKVQNLAQVGKIDRLRLVVKNLSTGECEFIEGKDKEPPTRGASPIKVVSPRQGQQIISKQEDTGIKNEGNRFTIKKAMRDDLLTNNMSEILTQARAVQLKRPDGSLAFKMTEIVPGSIYSKLNIQDGDVITGINGKSFNNLNEVMTLFSQIREIDNFQISLERDGMEQNLEYNFE